MDPTRQPIDALKVWLDKPVYTEGVRLYELHVGADFLLRLLKTGADDYNREKLLDALTARHAQLEAEQATKVAAYPAPLVSQLSQAGLLMDERTILKDRLRTSFNGGITEGEALQVMAFRILSITDLLDGIYGQQHFFDQNGFLPESAGETADASPLDLLRRRASVRTYVSKYAAELALPTTEKRRAVVQAKLQRYQAELHHLEGQLTQPT